MTGTLEYNSATYYRFAALNLDMLADKVHLGALSLDERKSVVRHFIEATVKAVPSARKNSMSGNTLPSYVLCVVQQGHPVQLVNAFETPVWTKSEGYVKASINKLEEEYTKLCTTWNLFAWKAVFPQRRCRTCWRRFLSMSLMRRIALHSVWRGLFRRGER